MSSDAKRDAPDAQQTQPICDPTAVVDHTRDPELADTSPSRANERAQDERERHFGERYLPLEVLGTGGMGQVLLVRDQRLGREVAAKVIRARHVGRRDIEARFVREAKVQGLLEHPAIVPVYDLGVTTDGDAYFTMKRVRGLALDQIVAQLKTGETKASERGWSRRKLLTAFAGVCLAIDFAHARGVLHRDLKPSNVMFGGFGEVYVLDWGIAKILGASAEEEHDSARTGDGGILGTPGYMAPEQLEKTSDELTARADIYSLGAILFELLALQPLHRRDSVSDTIRSTLQGADARAGVRAPHLDIPPELEAICVKACARRPADRYASAREMSDAIERFLDGDRDLAMRKQASTRFTDSANEKIARALSGDPLTEHADRASAFRELSSAIALDAGNSRAVSSMVRLMLEPPRTLPAEAKEEINRVRTDAKRMMARLGGMVSTTIIVAGVPGVLWMGLRDPRWAWFALAMLAIMTINSIIAQRMSTPRPWRRNVIFSCGMGMVLVSGQAFGPLIVAPGFCVAMLMPMVINAEPRHRMPLIAVAMTTLFLPLILELAGVLPASYQFVGESMCLVPKMVSFPAAPTLAMLSYWALMQVMATTLFAFMLHRKFTGAQESLQMNAWYLRQLVPKQG